MTWSICIFAHNEALLLPQCLAALEAASNGSPFVAHVLENGSTDNTYEIAKTFSKLDERIHAHQLAVGDKSNAWNEYVHRLSGDADMHIFIDGDVRPSPGAFTSLANAFNANPNAYGAAALPASGRSRKDWATRLFEEHYISGNLYALSRDAIQKIRTMPFRFPFGSVGEDGLLTYALLTDLKGYENDTHKDRIAVATDAFFEFDSLSVNPHDLKIYYNRLKRYSKRYVQNNIMYPILKRDGLAALPETIDAIFTLDALNSVKPRNDMRNFIIDRMTLHQLKAKAA